ncbi:thiol-disulfide oxidoreductase DCC family protein [Macrococcus bovicus]|uniref:thiol-disulfide oxidoreductase DCC family protein n=1 Tax=Macrococcus bovicus TaxID=69968 RepID=UPI0025A4F413|nr:DCC1-like thiol-disulfide oxidoreductase family protein [Macrococcus bovicus]WJP96769.1 DCC1-like thiol-disulfide oxidoreductase family protein [Macrococcus bovicus]
MHNIIFFDGDCSFCNKYIQFLIKFDKDNKFYFATLNSQTYKKFSDNWIPQPDIDSILYYKNSNFYYYSDAIIEILSDINIFFKVFKLIPQKIRDIFYKLFARHRYKFNKNSCVLPPKEVQYKFLD